MNNISTRSISKKYRLYHDKPMTLKERVLKINDPSWTDFWALKDVSFSISKGATVGVIGRNGSGKSTLLKLLSRILYPDSGSIEVEGRVSCLLELGAGFHSDFTGRENIYTNAAIFGLSRKEIDARINDIIDFSELQDFIDSPVRTYSTGMYMRLGFSIAVHVDPDILLIDEILAVGDANFQHKCFEKLQRFKGAGVTIVLVTHDTGLVERFCDQVLWLEGGTLENNGPALNVVMSYLEYMANLEKKAAAPEARITEPVGSDQKASNSSNNTSSEDKLETPNRWGSRDIEIYDVRLKGKDGNEKTVFEVGEAVNIELHYIRHDETIETAIFGVGFYTEDRIACYGTNTKIDRVKVKLPKSQKTGTGILSCSALNLVGGTYWIDVAVVSEDEHPYDYQIMRMKIRTQSAIEDVGVCRLNHVWRFDG